MKTAGYSTIAKVQFAFTLLLASLVVQSLAMPLTSLWNKEVRQERNTQLLHRSKRFAAAQSDYSVQAFLSRSSWRTSSCDATYNCAPVNPSHCSNDSVNFFCLDEVTTYSVGCQMNFTVLVEDGGTTEGAELALYKKTEPDTNSHLRYYVYIVYKLLSETYYSKVVGQRLIDSSCNSWQVFNIGSMKDDLPEGVHKFNLLVAVFKETEINQPEPLPVLNCSEVKSLFVMDTSADINEFKGIDENPESETPTETEELEVDEKGDEKSDKDENENESNTIAALDSNNEIEELASGSGAGKDLALAAKTTTIPPPPLIVEEDKVEDYLPTMAVFVRGGPNPLLKKRSAGESTKADTDPDKEADPATKVVEEEQMEENDESSGANCRLLENKVDLQALDPDIIMPTIEDIGKCSNSTDTFECRPTAFRNLEVLLKKTGDIQVPSLEIRHDYIITECTPFAKTQPSTDDLTSSGSTPLRRKRFIDETPEAEASKTNKLKDADKEDSEESSNANCRLIENKISLSTINPNILEPKILDIGKCSGSTDIMECRPTGFRHLQVVFKTHGNVSLNTLQNFITTECTPFFNTQSIPSA